MASWLVGGFQHLFNERSEMRSQEPNARLRSLLIRREVVGSSLKSTVSLFEGALLIQNYTET